MACHRKFGKQIQKQQLDLPEYAASFLNYKALKKVQTFFASLILKALLQSPSRADQDCAVDQAT